MPKCGKIGLTNLIFSAILNLKKNDLFLISAIKVRRYAIRKCASWPIYFTFATDANPCVTYYILGKEVWRIVFQYLFKEKVAGFYERRERCRAHRCQYGGWLP